MILFKHTLQRIFKNKLRLVLIVIMPLLFIILFTNHSEQSIIVGVVDKDHSQLSERLTEGLRKLDKVEVKNLNEKDVYDQTVAYQLDYTLIMEPGFQNRIMDGKNPGLKEFYVNEKEKLFYVRAFAQNYMDQMRMLAGSAGYDNTRFKEELKTFDSSKLKVVNPDAKDNKTEQSRGALGFLVQFMIYMSVITSGIILEDKQSGVFFRTFYAPVSLKRYILENFSAFVLIGVMQSFAIMLLVKFLLGYSLGKSTISMFILFMIFSVVCIAFGNWIVSLCKKPIHAYAIIFLITSPLIMLGGCYWSFDQNSDALNRIALFDPVTWVMKGADKILIEGKSILELPLEVGLLFIFAAIFLAAGLMKRVDVSK